MRRIFKISLVILLLGMAVMAAIPFLKEKATDCKEDKKQEAISIEIEDIVKNSENIVENLQKKNEDVVGFIEIPGTIINYPVMQTKDNPDFYLTHNFNKEYSFYGTPYLSAYCDIKTSDNLIIYGHNINCGRMFGALEQYKDKDFFEKHRKLYFTTDKKNTYEIWTVMSVNVNEFQYWEFTMARDEEDFDNFVDQVSKHGLFDSGKRPEYGEQMIMLSTCDNERGKDWRIVVVGYKL